VYGYVIFQWIENCCAISSAENFDRVPDTSSRLKFVSGVSSYWLTLSK